MPVHEIETDAEFRETIKNHGVVLIDFFAVWCGPCNVLAPLIEKHSNEDRYKDIYFAKIDVDKQSALADELDIQAMPTLVLFKDEKKVGFSVEPKPQALVEFLDQGV